ncbi:MAG: F0F1 ATP synthase subunit delta [Gammaproteobacteria bacterium]
MSELATLARPYAEAVFKRAKESASTVKWSDTLAFISAVVNDKLIAGIADNPRIGKDVLLQLMRDICKEQVDAEGENLIKLLVQNNRLKLAGQIAAIFEQFKAEDEGYVDVEVASAFVLSDDEKAKLSANLEKTLDKRVRLNVREDQSLIGGIVVRAGDRVFDGSIKGQLQHMRKALQ